MEICENCKMYMKPMRDGSCEFCGYKKSHPRNTELEVMAECFEIGEGEK